MINLIKLNHICNCFPTNFTIPTAVSNAFSIQEHICKLNYEINQLVDEVEQQLNNVIAAINNVDSALKELQTDFAELESRVNQEITAIEAKVNLLNTKVEELEAEIAAAEADIQKNHNDIVDINNDINLLTTRVENVENNITSINNSIDTINTDINSINNSIDSINNKIDTINSTISDMQQKIKTNTDDITVNASNIAKNVVDISNNSSAIQDLDEKVTTVKNNIESIESELNMIKVNETLNSYTSRYNVSITNNIQKNHAYGWNKTSKTWVNSPTGTFYASEILDVTGCYAIKINANTVYSEFPILLWVSDSEFSTDLVVLGYSTVTTNSQYIYLNRDFTENEKVYIIIQATNIISVDILSNTNTLQSTLICGGYVANGQISDTDNLNYSITDIALSDINISATLYAKNITNVTTLPSNAIDIESIITQINSNNYKNVVFITDYTQTLATRQDLNNYNEMSLSDVTALSSVTAKFIKLIDTCKSKNCNLIVVLTYLNFFNLQNTNLPYNAVIESNETILDICNRAGVFVLDLKNIFTEDTIIDPPNFNVWYTELNNNTVGNDFFYRGDFYLQLYKYILRNIKDMLYTDESNYNTVTHL